MGMALAGDRGSAGQSYRERRPVPELAPVVASVWVQRIAPGAAPYPHRSVPSGSVELRCRVGAAVQVAGPLTRPRLEVLPPGTTVVGIRFRAGAAAGVLGVRPSELADGTVDAAELWGRAGATLGGRVADALGVQMADCGAGEAAGLLEQALIGRLADAAGPDLLVAEAVRRMMSGRPEDVGALRSSLFVSERQFRRRCEAATGLAPKALQRMLRFQGFLARVQFALAQGRPPAAAGLGRLAAEAGYADQSHLARECRRLTGLSPRAFLGQTEQQCGAGHDHRASFAPLLRPGPAGPAGWPGGWLAGSRPDGRSDQERAPDGS
jgi:AraC-like DNA-binding protein